MRAELKLLRSEHPDFMPVSKMKKADISSLLEKMKQHTEITPAVAKTKGEPTKPAKGDATAPKVKAMSAEAKESKVMPLKEKAEKPMKAMKEKAPKEKEMSEPKKKESIAERMARIREMRKKE
jgi:hypothetical protein